MQGPHGDLKVSRNSPLIMAIMDSNQLHMVTFKLRLQHINLQSTRSKCKLHFKQLRLPKLFIAVIPKWNRH